VVILLTKVKGGPGHHAPARFLRAGLIALASLPAAATAQAPARPGPPPAGAPPVAPGIILPDPATSAKMIWSTMAAVDHAIVTGNYSVLRELGSPSFQARNTPDSLAANFQSLRNERVDLSAVLLVEPVYDIPPSIVGGNLMRVRGVFPMRPSPIAFDLLFQPNGGRWALHGIAVAPVSPLPPGNSLRH
jgi:hypothetical protein